MKNSDKRVALVSGANRGLGFEVCRQLAQKGITVILTSRNQVKGKKAKKSLSTQYPNTVYHPLDVTSQESVDALFKFVSEKFGRLDILVNNAGIMLDHSRSTTDNQGSSFFRTDMDTIRLSLETNTYGAIRLIQKFVPLMKTKKYGRIVNVSSGMGQLSEMNGRWPGYRLSKTALNAVTRVVADELKGEPILINSVCPGWVKTEIGGPHAELSVEEGADTIVWLATLPNQGPSGGFFRERKRIAW